MDDRILHAIQKNDYFKNLNSGNRILLAEICIPRKINKKEPIFLEGEKGHALFLCAMGTVQLHKTSASGQEVVLKVMGPGELFGEVILFEKDCYPASAVALEETLIYLIPKVQFHCLLERSEFRNEFISILMQKMRYLAEQIRYLTVHDVEERFWKFLSEHASGRRQVPINVSKKDVAAAIGTTPETLSRLILRLKKEKKLIWEGKRITVLHVP